MLSEGVGARHKETKKALGVAGYLDICTGSEIQKKTFSNDPRLLELREIGLARHWLDIAETVGFDVFIVFWRKLSDSELLDDDKRYVYVPRFGSWLRYQRNRVILSLRSSGTPYIEIQQKILEDLGEVVSIPHIRRIACETKRKK